MVKLQCVQIASDPLSQIAAANWSAEALESDARPAFQPELVQTIYDEHLGGAAGKPPGLRKVMLLEISQFLENYLWPNFEADTATPQHVLSILLMINEKFRENVPAWACFEVRRQCRLTPDRSTLETNHNDVTNSCMPRPLLTVDAVDAPDRCFENP